MDQRLQNIYRQYLQDADWASYMRYYAAAERADVEPVCWAGVGECPHCVLAQIDRLYEEKFPVGHGLIHRHIDKMFRNYQLTPNGTYLLERAPLQLEGPAPWLPALYYALIPRREAYTSTWQHQDNQYTATHIPRVPPLIEIRGHGELCWGSDPYKPNNQKSKEEGIYGFEEWPQPENARDEDFHPDFNRWIEEIQRISDNCGAVYADIEAKPLDKEFIHPELGPINMHGDKWHMFRITFLDEAGYQPPQHETLFIGQCLDNEEGCYGRDQLGSIDHHPI